MLPGLHLGLRYAEEVQTQHDTVSLPLREELEEERLSPLLQPVTFRGLFRYFLFI